MKSLISSICVIAILLVSSVAFGEIVVNGVWVPDGGGYGFTGGNPSNSNGWANAVGEDPSSWAEANGWMEYTVTEDTYCDWNYVLQGYSYVDVYRYGEVGPHYAYASSFAHVFSPYFNDVLSTYAYLDEEYKPESKWPDVPYVEDDPGDKEDNDSRWFYENESLYFSHYVYVEADITEDSDEDAFALAIVFACGDLEAGSP